MTAAKESVRARTEDPPTGLPKRPYGLADSRRGRPGYSGAFCHSLASRHGARYRLRASRFRARPRVPPAAPGVEVVYDAEPWTLVDAGCRLVPLGAGKESLNHWDSEGTGL